MSDLLKSVPPSASRSPEVSVITAAHNAERWIDATLQSIIEQAPSIQLIVVDDGSGDETLARVGKWRQPGLEVVELPRSVGAVEARNVGLRMAVAPWVAVCDADDVMLPDKLQAQLDALSRSDGANVCGTAYSVIDEHGTAVATVPCLHDHEDIVREMYSRNPFAHSSVVMSRELLLSVRGWLRGPGEDYDLWFRLRCEGARFLGINVPLLLYRVHAASRTARRGREQALTASTTKAQLWKQGLPRRSSGAIAAELHRLRHSSAPLDADAAEVLRFDQTRLLLTALRRRKVVDAASQLVTCLRTGTLTPTTPDWMRKLSATRE